MQRKSGRNNGLLPGEKIGPLDGTFFHPTTRNVSKSDGSAAAPDRFTRTEQMSLVPQFRISLRTQCGCFFFVLAAARYLFWAPPFGLLSLISPDDLLTGGEFPQKRKSAPGACERISKKPTPFFNIFVGNFSKNVHHRNQHTSGEFLRNFIGKSFHRGNSWLRSMILLYDVINEQQS